MARLRYTDVVGTIGSGNLTSGATSHTFTAPLTYGGGATVVPTLAGTDYFLLSVLTTAGAVQEVVKVTAYNSGTGAATIVRAQEGTTGTAATSGDKVTTGAYPSDLETGILAVTTYGPVSSTQVTTTSGTHADLDATNLAITFTAPTSGKVLVTLNGWANLINISTVYAWGLRESTTVIADQAVGYAPSGAGTLQFRHTARLYITGLTPGSSHTYKWAHRLWSGSGSCGTVWQLGNEAVMTVEAVPA